MKTWKLLFAMVICSHLVFGQNTAIWEVSQGHCSYTTNGDNLYLLGEDKILAFDPSTGLLKWEAPCSIYKSQHHQILSDDKRIYAIGTSKPSYQGYVIAFDAKNGNKLWEFKHPEKSGSPKFSGVSDDVLVYDGDENTYALDANLGKKLFSKPNGGSYSTVKNNRIYIKYKGVIEYDMRGKTITDLKINNADITEMSYVDDNFLITRVFSNTKNVVVFDRKNDKVLWQKETESKLMLLTNIVVGIDETQGIHAYEKSTGSEMWSYKMDEALSAISADENSLIAYSRKGLVVRLDASTGKELWKETVDNSINGITLLGSKLCVSSGISSSKWNIEPINIRMYDVSHMTAANYQETLDREAKAKRDAEFKNLVNEQRKNTLLTIKHGGHISLIRKMVVSNDGKNIITAGDDKVIYIRNAKTGDVIDALYGQIGEGSHGQIYAMALSPDNKYLAVAGFFSDAYDYSGRIGAIRLYDFPNRKLICLLQEGESDVVNALAFSDDSKYLVSAAGTIMKIWNIDNRSFKTKFAIEHLLPIYSVAVFNDKVISGSNDKTVRLWNLAGDKSLKVDSTHTAGVNCVAFSPDGLTIASGGFDNKLVIYDNQLNVKQIIENGTSPTCIAFSPDGKRILLGTEGETLVSNLYVFDGKSWIKEVSYSGLSNSATLATAFIDSKTALCAGGDSYEIVKWTWQTDPKTKQVAAKELNRFTGKGKPIYNIGFKDNQLFYTNVYEEDAAKIVMTNSFDLFSKKITEITSLPADYAKSILKMGEWSLALEQNDEKELMTGIQLEKRVLKVTKEGSSGANRIKKDYYEGFEHLSYTFAANSKLNRTYVLSGGTRGIIMAYDIYGTIQSRLIGHRDLVNDIIVSPDGRFIFSCSSDQTIKIWSTLDLGKQSSTVPAPADVVDPQFLSYFEQRNLVKTSKKATFEAWDVIITDLNTLGFLDEADYVKKMLFFFSAGVVNPVATIFIGSDGEWIIWSEDGYFTCSKYGGKYIGYHLNKGFDKEARFYPFEQFDLKYNRPDIMLERLGINDEVLKAAYFKAYKKRLSKMGISEDDLSAYINLPEVTLLSRSQETTAREIDVEFDAKDDFFKINRINIFVNDVPVFGSRGKSVKKFDQQAIHQKLTVKLKKGKNKIQVSALNEKGVESLRETYNVIRNDATPQQKDRYVVAIGVSDYSDDNFDLKFASKDAKDLANLLQSNKTEYANTKVLLILDKQATRENILKAKEFFMQSKFEDQAILFVAGHGLLDENLDWYFATTDVDFKNPSAKGIIYSDLEGILDSIPSGNKLMFMDACHSGEVDKEESQLVANDERLESAVKSRGFMKVASKNNSLGLQNSFQLMQSIFTDVSKSTGTNVISSASGAEYAYESATWNNGVFTYALLEGLKTGKADADKNKEITVSEIRNYVFSRVAELTNGKQTPTSRKENLEFDFRVW